ncbi:hypothetical protein ACFQZ2_12325, partial [Streptomonospora algeriensis]
MEEAEWRGFLAGFHRVRPGVTERLLSRTDGEPYAWLTAPLRTTGGPVLDLACGSAPTRAELPGARWMGLDSAEEELA